MKNKGESMCVALKTVCLPSGKHLLIFSICAKVLVMFSGKVLTRAEGKGYNTTNTNTVAWEGSKLSFMNEDRNLDCSIGLIYCFKNIGHGIKMNQRISRVTLAVVVMSSFVGIVPKIRCMFVFILQYF